MQNARIIFGFLAVAGALGACTVPDVTVDPNWGMGGAAGSAGNGGSGGVAGGAGGYAGADSSVGGAGGIAGAGGIGGAGGIVGAGGIGAAGAGGSGGSGGTDGGGMDAGNEATTGGAGGTDGGGDAGAGGVADSGGPDGPCVSETEATFCARQGRVCGIATGNDNCGVARNVYTCGVCSGTGVTCGVDGKCNPCVPENDAQFCGRLSKTCDNFMANDNCGVQRTVNCGACTLPQTCGGGGTPNKCGCTYEGDTAFCGRVVKNCGTVTAVDNCGTSRPVDCGTCTPPQTCGGATPSVPNVCGCTYEGDTAFCKRIWKNCGAHTAIDNCGTPHTASCGGCTAPQTCSINGVCGFVPSTSPSCTAGLTACNGESCCTAFVVPGGQFPMGRGTENCGAVGCRFETGNEGCPNGMSCGSAELPEHPMTIGSFALDKYEVTVGRFRKFVTAYAAPAPGGFRPPVNSGANPNVNMAVNNTSWLTGWDDSTGAGTNLPATGATAAMTQSIFAARIGACSSATWTDNVMTNENKAINCVNWYEAFAFCIWDGGRLPTEAEWEFAAAGGDLNLLYPWGSAAPDCTYANFLYGTTQCFGGVIDVGSLQKANGRWDHADLAGNAGEWVFDWYGAYSTAQTNNYANTTTATNRVTRGGSWGIDMYTVRAAYRNFMTPISHNADVGFRCARTP